jgi:hypothetical protein
VKEQKMQKFTPEGISAIKTILRCMQEADAAFQSLNADENKACFEFHNEGSSLNHCIRWGLNAAQEIQESVSIESVKISKPKDDPNPDGEYFPGATREEVGSVMMQDVVGDYDMPETVPEWTWVERVASFNHCRNGQDGIWEFVLNLSRTFENVPENFKDVLKQARDKNLSYLIIHQGT